MPKNMEQIREILFSGNFTTINTFLEESPIDDVCNAMKSRVGAHTFTGVLLMQKMPETLSIILSKIHQSSPSKYPEVIREQDELGRTMLHLALYNHSSFTGKKDFELFETM